MQFFQGLLIRAGGTQRLPKLIGLGPAKKMILFGNLVKSQEALDLGLCEEVVEDYQQLFERKKYYEDLMEKRVT